MSDIVERLRDDQPGERQCVREARMDLGCLLMEAADEIEKLREVLRAFIYTGNVVQGYRVGQNPPPPTASEEEAWEHYGGSEFHYQQWLEWRAVQMGRELLGEKG
jgi:hypothetical protein